MLGVSTLISAGSARQPRTRSYPSPAATPCTLEREPETRNPKPGFSLMELIIVLTLIMILAGAVMPVFRGTFARVQGDHAVRDFVAAVRYAQERAVTDTQVYRLYLDPENNAYWIMRLKHAEGKKKQFEAIDERFGETVYLPARLKMGDLASKGKAKKDRNQKAYYWAFYPNGASDLGSVSLKRLDGKMVTITLKGSLGDLEVNEE